MVSSLVSDLPVTVCGPVRRVVGTILHFRPLFQTAWLMALGKPPESTGHPSPVSFILGFFAAEFEAFFLVSLLKLMAKDVVAAGLQAISIVRLGFVASINVAIDTFEGKGCGAWVIAIGAHVVTFLIIRLI